MKTIAKDDRVRILTEPTGTHGLNHTDKLGTVAVFDESREEGLPYRVLVDGNGLYWFADGEVELLTEADLQAPDEDIPQSENREDGE